MLRRTPSGFTLLEALVALAVFCLAAIVLGAAYANILGGYRDASLHSAGDAGCRLARREILRETDRTKASRPGRMDFPGTGELTWTVAIGETALADLFTVQLQGVVRAAAPAASGNTVEFREDFLLYRPTWSTPETRDRLRRQSAGPPPR